MDHPKYPSWRYRRLLDGQVENKLFQSEPTEAGWVDSPAKLEGDVMPGIRERQEPAGETLTRKRKKPRSKKS
jgi:hypothetical protein